MGEIPFGAAQGVPQEDGQLLFLLAGREDRPRQSTIKACHTDGLSDMVLLLYSGFLSTTHINTNGTKLSKMASSWGPSKV